MEKKKIFRSILLVTVVVLSILPVIVTFSSVLTSLFVRMRWYTVLQESVVPFESRLVAVLIRPLGITGQVTSKQEFSMVLIKGTEAIPIRLEWNCLGWQSMILLAITLVIGLRGDYTIRSKAETLVVGILGTFLSNLLRMAFIVSLAYYWNTLAAMIIHDYFASFVALVWMLFFWWFSYRYILEDKTVVIPEKTIKV
ncbi:MAG TPA: exosortase/archaeosortase family protein [Candidatus Saccharimonadales bacterium]|jgi:exosortase/archaeosortase family protein|nr:exosortase/archaeosortase family protein [Candidatus Saccharimonadales bacterium]